MSDSVHEFTHAGYKIKIQRDEDACNPREDDNLGTMVCFHRRYSLGDGYSASGKPVDRPFDSPEEFKQWVEAHPDAEVLPLYLYDHSGITMSTTGFSCPWDSGQVGWIYVSAERIRSEYSVKRITKKTREKARRVLVSEVTVYDMYLKGEVYGYSVEDDKGNHIDSCWGYYGYGKGEDSSWEYMLQCAKDAAESAAENNCVAAGI